MKLLYLPALIAIFILTGCNTGTMSSTSYDPVTGKTTEKLYSKYYDAGDWALPGKIGISIVADQQKKEAPGLYSVQQALGALGPDDLDAEAEIKIYLWNETDRSYQMQLGKFTYRNAIRQGDGRTVTLPPHQRIGGLIGVISIPNYETKLDVSVEYRIEGKPGKLYLELQRRTFKENERYFSRNGIPPYPWRHNAGVNPPN